MLADQHGALITYGFFGVNSSMSMPNQITSKICTSYIFLWSI